MINPPPSLYGGDGPAVGVPEHELVAAAVLWLQQLCPGVELSLHLPHLHHLQHILTQGAPLVLARLLMVFICLCSLPGTNHFSALYETLKNIIK